MRRTTAAQTTTLPEIHKPDEQWRLVAAPYRGGLPPLRRSSGPGVPRRAPSHPPALLHQLLRAVLRACAA